jgi:hypothetical protein
MYHIVAVTPTSSEDIQYKETHIYRRFVAFTAVRTCHKQKKKPDLLNDIYILTHVTSEI